MLERLVLLAVAVGLAVVVGRLWQRWREHRLATVDARDVSSAVPTLLYFTAEWCGQCRLQQRPIIEALLARTRDYVHLREVDVEDDTELARRFGVVTLPTTVVVAPSGRVVARNTGLADQRQLDRQIKAALPNGDGYS